MPVFLMTNNLMTFFKLEDNEQLFKQALKPKSLGGSDEFKRWAREGDLLFDQALAEIFNETRNVGDLNKVMTSIHSSNCLVAVGYYLGIDQQMLKYYGSSVFTNNDIKEAIEALLYASRKVNDKKTIKGIVENILEIIEENNFFDINYKGRLQELHQKNNYPVPEYFTIDAGGPPHDKRWQSKVKDDYFGTNKEFVSDVFSSLKDAEQDAAHKFLYALGEVTRKESGLLQATQTGTVVEGKISQSFEQSEIVFSKLADNGFSVPPRISKDTGETLVEWFERKRKKNPFTALLLLNARVEEITGSTRYATLDEQELVLLNITINGDSFFELGTGTSRTKARKDAAKKILVKSKLTKWLQKHKKNERI
jgi:dsRNA-specific ribonuclease